MCANIQLHIIPEFEISRDIRTACYALIQDSYQSTSNPHSIDKQFPSFRILHMHDNVIISHIAVEYRKIKIDDSYITIYGLKDVCVDKSYRNKGLATKLIGQLKDMAFENHVDALILIAPEKALYHKCGFSQVQANLRWTFLQQGKSLGILDREFSDDFMIWMNTEIIPKVISKKVKKKKDLKIDLMGHIF